MTYWGPPIVQRGVGPLTGGALNDVTQSTHWLRAHRQGIAGLLSGTGSPDVSPPWLGTIASSTLVSGCTRRWTYTVTPVDLTALLGIAANANTRHLDPAAASTYATCYNLYEWPTTGTTDPATLGDGSDPAHIPTGFAVMPVRGIVWIRRHLTTTATYLQLFDRPNGIDGTCP